jgi:hypothetical protein
LVRTSVLEELAVELLMKRIQELLRTKDVSADIDSDGELMFIAMCGTIVARIVISANDSAVIARAYIPLVVPVHRRHAMFECLALANWQLKFNRFEIDAEDGELRCRADMPLYDAVPTDKQLTRLIYTVWSVTEQYAPALLEVTMGQAEPAVAVARVERKETEPIRRRQEKDLTVN